LAGILIGLTIGLPWLGALLVWQAHDRRPRLQHTFAVLFSVAAGAACLALIPYSSAKIAISIPVGGAFGDFTFVADGLGLLLACVATVVGSLAVIFSVNYMHAEAQLGRYYALVLFFIGAMAGLVLASNLLLVFGFWEITALCSYALISFHNDDTKAVAGGIKALVITQLGGIGLLGLAALSYAYFGTYDLNIFLSQAPSLPAKILALAAFGCLIAAAAKSSQFPFQTWLPDAMEAPTPVSALIHAATMVNAGVYLIGRFFPAFESVPGWRNSVIAVGVLSACMAGIMALVSNDLKRVLAYSTVSQLGYMFYAVGAGDVFASKFHLLSHAIFKALLFLGAGAVIHAVGTRDMFKMGSLGKRMPIVRATFLVGSLALIGFPFLNGFWSKEMVLEAGLKGPLWAYIIMLLTAGLTALYTFRCVWLVFYGKPRSDLPVHDAGTAMRISLIVLSFGTVTSWLLAGSLGILMQETMPYHLIHRVTNLEMIAEILTAPATLLAIVVIGLGLAAWWWRSKLTRITAFFKWLVFLARSRFGFEHLNEVISSIVQSSGEALRFTQTGLLGWNVFGIILGLILLLVIMTTGVL
jgi:NADH-quinone oxidoreductase subunit L